MRILILSSKICMVLMMQELAIAPKQIGCVLLRQFPVILQLGVNHGQCGVLRERGRSGDNQDEPKECESMHEKCAGDEAQPAGSAADVAEKAAIHGGRVTRILGSDAF
jgi:hypothetical protein